jgi:rare lipoprotein A
MSFNQAHLLKAYRFCRNLGTLLPLSLLAGCMQPPGLIGEADHTTPGTERSKSITAVKPPETEGVLLVPRTSDLPGFQAEGPASQDDNEDAWHFRESGPASWYGGAFQGRRTASEERYDLHALTAAHRTLPPGSYVRVTAMTNARPVIVRINDRGPYPRGRVIDLSYAAPAPPDLPRAGALLVGIERVGKWDAGTG